MDFVGRLHSSVSTVVAEFTAWTVQWHCSRNHGHQSLQAGYGAEENAPTWRSEGACGREWPQRLDHEV